MRILQLGKFYPPVFGGIQNVMYEFTTGLNAENIHCDVLCSNNKNKYEVINHDTYKVFKSKSYGLYFSTSITPQMISILKKIQDDYDVISIHFPDPMAAFALYMSKPKGKVILHWHSDVIKQKYLLKLFEPLQKWVINRADLIIGATEMHIKSSDQANIMLEKSIVLPYPFDSKKFKECVNNELLSALKLKYQGKKIIFAMGRLVYYKGFEYLIEAATHLNDDYIILIGGEGKLKADFEEKIKNSNLQTKVELLGFIHHNVLGTYYELCDLFCLPANFRSEMFGIVQIEAMSFGKPIITSNIARSGICHVNIDNVTGVCVEPESPLAIANAAISIMEDQNKYTQYSKNCKKRVEEVFNKKVIIQELIKIYKQVLTKTSI